MLRDRADLMKFAFVALVGTASFSASAADRLIDDFIDGAQLLTPVDILPVSNTAGGLEPTSVIGGERQMTFRTVGGPFTASAEVNPTAGELTVTTTDYGYLDLKYGAFSSLNADLLADGGSQFEIKFSSLSLDLFRGGYELEVFDNHLASDIVIFDQQMYDLSGSGTVVIPFSAFSGLDFSAISQIHVDMTRIEPGMTMVIDSIKVTPEPLSVVLLSLGSFLLRRR